MFHSRPSRIIDLKNQKFGRLTVLELSKERDTSNKIQWICLCDCGKKTQARSNDLRRKKMVSCGCLKEEQMRKKMTTHGMRYHFRTYHSWSAMIARCLNKNNKRFYDYGGRGIKVCERWLDIKNFIADMGERPKNRTLDRINVNGNYEPSNCRWATTKQQANNKRVHLSLA